VAWQAVEQSFLRVPDFRELKDDPEVRWVNYELASKRNASGPCRKLRYPGSPMDSTGGTFSIPNGIKQRPRPQSAKLAVHPPVDSDDPNLNTVYPFVGGADTNPNMRSMRPQSAFERREANKVSREAEGRYRRTMKQGKFAKKEEDPYKVIKYSHCKPNVRSWYW